MTISFSGKTSLYQRLRLPHRAPPGHAASFAPSILSPNASPTEPDNPTVLPTRILQKFQFACRIRHPRRSVSSLYRCTVPPLSSLTGWDEYLPSEAGYEELRRLFDYVRAQHLGIEEAEGPGICLADADDLLDDPSGTLEKFCHLTNLEYNDDMLSWNTEEQQELARKSSRKWKGFHEDVLEGSGLKARDSVSQEH